MTNVLLFLQFALTVILTIAVMLQKSSSIGLGAYSGSNESLFGAKGPAGFLAKFTFAMGILFILNTLALGYSYNKETKSSLADQVVKMEENSVPKSPLPQSPTDNQTPKAPIAK